MTIDATLVQAFQQEIARAKTILIGTHLNPDGDALGSALGLALYLESQGKAVEVICHHTAPRNLKFLPTVDRVSLTPSREDFDLGIIVDLDSFERLGSTAPYFEKQDRLMVIDHHVPHEAPGDLRIIDTGSAATALIITLLLQEMGAEISPEMATCFYTGISTDTGSFRHPSTTGDVHRMAAFLVDRKINVSNIHRQIYDNVSLEKLRMLGYVLNEKLRVLPEYKFAYITLSDSELKRFRSKTGDTEGLVNYALSVEGVVGAAILIDRGDEIRISFRSIGDFSVRDLASRHFNGGGHRNAAGGRSRLSLAETEDWLLSVLPMYQEQLLETH